MTLFFSPTVLIPIHAVVQIGSNGFRAFLMRRDILYSVIPAFVIGTLIGSYIGGKTLIRTGNLGAAGNPWCLRALRHVGSKI